ncbi:MAG: fluoride efflux transporter CrcB [Alphaproteobacteria bacterium]
MILAYVAAGGAIGAVLRYLSVQAAGRLFGAGFPWGTFGVNIIGSFLIGIAVAWLATKAEGTAEMRALLVTGVLGGFTTFSAFSLDVIQLLERKAHMEASLYALGSVGVSVLFCFAGLALMRGALS